MSLTKTDVRNFSNHLRPGSNALTAGYSVRVLLALMIVAISCSPPAYSASNEVIWERGDQIVMLAAQDVESAQPNDHPIAAVADEIATMFVMLRMRFVDEGPEVAPITVFTQDEIANLSTAVATGLGRAAPSQDVLFHVIGSRRVSPGAFAKRNRVTAGRIFYREGRVNIIFGQVQTPYRKKNVYGQIDEDFYPRNYGSRKVETEHEIVLQVTDAIRLHQNGDTKRPDWIAIDPVAAAAAAERSEESDVQPASVAAATVATVGLVEATAADKPVAEVSEAGISQAQEANVQSTLPAASVEERLTELKRLLELDLISEEAYEARMKDILKDL